MNELIKKILIINISYFLLMITASIFIEFLDIYAFYWIYLFVPASFIILVPMMILSYKIRDIKEWCKSLLIPFIYIIISILTYPFIVGSMDMLNLLFYGLYFLHIIFIALMPILTIITYLIQKRKK